MQPRHRSLWALDPSQPRSTRRASLSVGAARCAAAVSLGVAIALTGCETPPEAAAPVAAPAAATPAAPTQAEPAPPLASAPPTTAIPEVPQAYRDAVELQRTRLRRLQFLESRGVVELRWTDERGAHFEQGDVDLYLMPPWKTALNISKLGERFAWIGSDEEAWWLFLLKEKPSSVEIHPWPKGEAEGPLADVGGEGMSVVSPKAILDLAGLSRYPAPGKASVTLDEAAKTMVVESRTPVRGEARLRWTVQVQSALPTRVDVLDAAGAVIATGTLEAYVSAPIDGVAPGDFPQVPKRITVRRADGTGEIKLSLDVPSGRGERVQARFFDLKELQRAFRPDAVYLRVAPSPASGSAPPTGEGTPPWGKP